MVEKILDMGEKLSDRSPFEGRKWTGLRHRFEDIPRRLVHFHRVPGIGILAIHITQLEIGADKPGIQVEGFLEQILRHTIVTLGGENLGEKKIRLGRRGKKLHPASTTFTGKIELANVRIPPGEEKMSRTIRRFPLEKTQRRFDGSLWLAAIKQLLNILESGRG